MAPRKHRHISKPEPALTPTHVRKLRHTKRDLIKKGLPLPVVEKHLASLQRAWLTRAKRRIDREYSAKMYVGMSGTPGKDKNRRKFRRSTSFSLLGSSLDF